MRCAVVSVVACVTLAGCVATKHARSVEPSGFLQDLYPQMREGKGDEVLLVYRNPNVDWSAKATYKKVLLDPVMIWRGKDSKMEGIDAKDAQVIAGAFYALMYQELAKDYEMVTPPGPKTFRMQAALTEAEQSSPGLDILSSVPAPFNVAFVVSTIKTLSTGIRCSKAEPPSRPRSSMRIPVRCLRQPWTGGWAAGSSTGRSSIPGMTCTGH